MPQNDGKSHDLKQLSDLLDKPGTKPPRPFHRGLWPLEHGPSIAGPSLAGHDPALFTLQRDIHRLSTRAGMRKPYQHGCRTTLPYRPRGDYQRHQARSNPRVSTSPLTAATTTAPALSYATTESAGQTPPNPRRMGMSITTHRARMIGGELRVEDAEGGGNHGHLLHSLLCGERFENCHKGKQV